MPQKSLLVRTVALVKRNPWRTITTAVAVLGGLPAAYAGAVFLEPVAPAHRAYVRDQVHEAQNATLPVLRDLQVDIANRAKRDEVDKKTKWTIERAKTKDPATLDMIDRQLRDSEATINALDEQLTTVKQLRAKGQ